MFQCCQSYVDALERRFSETRQNLGPRIIAIQGLAVLRNAIEAAEEGTEFQQLVEATQTGFNHIHKCSNSKTWANALQNLFRRAGFYETIFEQKPISAATIHDLISDQFQRRATTKTYLAPLELVRFAGGPMDFGTFQIRRYSQAQLEELLRNAANQAFYPWAETDLNLLTQYWYLSVTKSVPTHRISVIPSVEKLLNTDLGTADEVKVQWPRIPQTLEFPLRTLALFDWKPDNSRLPQLREHFQHEWQGFSIPFVLRVTDNLLEPPTSAPNLTGLSLELRFDTEGEEIGEEPWTPINLDSEESLAFEATIKRTGQLLAGVKTKEHGWDFIDVALNYLFKAFFAGGLDQLLWHITVVEALVGENKEGGLLEILRRRVGRALAKTESERKALRKSFSELYNFRSQLVHGSPFEKNASIEHLTQARDIARTLLLWFLQFAQTAQQGSGPYPTREDFLRLLDLDCAERARLVHLAQRLPADFPFIEHWAS